MGSQLFRRIEARAMGGSLPPLSNTAMLVLYIAAMTAHDTGTETAPEACYFRGWEHLSRAMGYGWPSATGRRAVARGIAELEAAGLMKRDYWPEIDRRKAVYRITP